MKKLIALLLALVMVIGLVACGAKEEPKADAPVADAPAADAPAADAPAADEGYTIAMLPKFKGENYFDGCYVGAQKAADESDGIYIPTDNTAASCAETIGSVVGNTPVIVGEEGICKGCGVATLSISYYDLGAKAAEMAYEILVNGASPAEMPIAYVSEGITEKYNAELAEKLNITIPEGMVAIGE